MGAIKRAERFSELPEGRRYIGVVTDLRTGSLSDLSVAIVGGALADMVLLQALEAHRNRVAQSGADGFPRKIPREFGLRIDLGGRAGLYGRWVHEELHTIREIRNAAAHGIEVFDFSDQMINGHTSELRFGGPRFGLSGRPAPVTSRQRFVQALEMVTQLLITDITYRAHGFRTERLIRAGGAPVLKAPRGR